MVEITLREESLDLTDPVLVDGLPGVGLVGKIATDYLITHRGMQYIGDVTGDELPKLAVFERQDPEVKSPVRLFADEELDLLALRSDIPISNVSIPTFASGLNRWLKELGVTPLYLSGYPGNPAPDAQTTVYGVGTGAAVSVLSDADIPPPVGSGMISGPAGALLSDARAQDLGAIGLVVETNPQYPDPQGAQLLIDEGINRFLPVSVDSAPLREQAERIVSEREELAERIQDAERHERSQTTSVDMY